MEMEGIQNEGDGDALAIPNAGGSNSQQEDASVPGEMNSDSNNDSEMLPYASWAGDVAASTRSSSAVDPLPENILHVMNQVFQNDMLLENILEKIILDGDRTSVRSCRLVSKQWVCALAKIYKKLKKPQFIVDTNKEAVLMEPRIRPVFEQHTLLYDFTKPMIRHDRIEGFIPTFSLHLGPTYFRKSSYSDFVNCLVQCGSSLVELYIRFPKNSTMSFLLPPGISLPNLNTFGVSFSNQALLTHPYPGTYHYHTDFYPNHCTIHLVQSLLNVSTNLRHFHFMPCVAPTNPPDMENLYLPETLTSVRIDTPLREFEMFLRRNFPCLTELHLNATMALYSEEHLFELFNKLSRTLRHVWLTGTQASRSPLSIRLPRMDNVTKFVIFKPWEFEERSPPTIFDEIFPNLKTLVFANQTEHSFQYLMSGMRSTSVTSFCVWLTSNRLYRRGPDNEAANPARVRLADLQIRIRQFLEAENNGPLAGDMQFNDWLQNPNNRHMAPINVVQINPDNHNDPHVAAENEADRERARAREVLERRRRVRLEMFRRLRQQNEQMRMAVIQNQQDQNYLPAGYRNLLRQGVAPVIPLVRGEPEPGPARDNLPNLVLNGRHLPPLPRRPTFPFQVAVAPMNAGERREMEMAMAMDQEPEAQPRVVLVGPRADELPQPQQVAPLVDPNMHGVRRRVMENIERAREIVLRRRMEMEQEPQLAPVNEQPEVRVPVPQRNGNNNPVAQVLNANNANNGVNEPELIPQEEQMQQNEGDNRNQVPEANNEGNDDLEIANINGQEMGNFMRAFIGGVAAPPGGAGEGDERNNAERADNDDAVQGPGPRNPQLGDPPARRLRPNRARQRMRPGGMILRGEPNQDGNDPWQVAVRFPQGPQGHPPFRGHIQIHAPAARAPLPERPITMTKEKLNCINLAFPNLVKLTINLCGPGTCGLKYIFEEMKSLQSLRVIVETSLWSINWDSVLTGISPEFCEAIKANSQLWDEVYLNENHVSIRNMTNLKELFLLECFKLNEQQSTNQVLDARCVSDVAFHFAILKMKNLKHLTVTPGFTPSQAMYRKWHEEKGFPIKTRPKTRLDLNFYESLED